MHFRSPALLPTALAAFLVGCAQMPTLSGLGNAASTPTVAAVSNGPEQNLKKGMTAEEVKRIMGPPAEIKPMASPTGKAEVWVYHRTSSTPIQQVQVGTRSTSVSPLLGAGSVASSQSIDVPVFADEVEITDETIRLLMFDDKLIEQKISTQKRLEYQQ